jgi:hypothetical protein
MLEHIYQERLTRYLTAMRGGRPDRVPLRLFVEEFAARYAGYSNYETACDYRLAFEATRRCVAWLGCDAAMSNAIVNWMGLARAIGWKALRFPGLGLPMESAAQWTEPVDEEGAFLKADEYDELADDPTAFLVNRWLPRFTDHIGEPGRPVTLEHDMALINGALSFHDYMVAFGTNAGLLRTQAGIVNANAGTLKAPLDILADKMRGYPNLCFDLMERRDKVISACEALMPHLLRTALSGSDPAGSVPVTIWMHRGCVPFISRRDFQDIYWQTLKPIVQEIWAQGHQVLFYAEGDWSAHLESFAELPEASIIFHVDRTDIHRVRQVLGGRFCTSGGVPNHLLTTGAPDRVRQRCREVIDVLGRDGAYIMDASALIMDDAQVENVEAMVSATLEHGVYSRGAGPCPPGPDAAPPSADAVSLAEERPPGAPLRGARPPGRRPSGVVIPWETKRAEFTEVTGNEALARRIWEEVDGMGYAFLWTNLTW